MRSLLITSLAMLACACGVRVGNPLTSSTNVPAGKPVPPSRSEVPVEVQVTTESFNNVSDLEFQLVGIGLQNRETGVVDKVYWENAETLILSSLKNPASPLTMSRINLPSGEFSKVVLLLDPTRLGRVLFNNGSSQNLIASDLVGLDSTFGPALMLQPTTGESVQLKKNSSARMSLVFSPKEMVSTMGNRASIRNSVKLASVETIVETSTTPTPNSSNAIPVVEKTEGSTGSTTPTPVATSKPTTGDLLRVTDIPSSVIGVCLSQFSGPCLDGWRPPVGGSVTYLFVPAGMYHLSYRRSASAGGGVVVSGDTLGLGGSGSTLTIQYSD